MAALGGYSRAVCPKTCAVGSFPAENSVVLRPTAEPLKGQPNPAHGRAFSVLRELSSLCDASVGFQRC